MSMDPRLLAIPVAFIILAAIACWYAISVKGKWWIKLCIIITVPCFGIVSWYAMTSYFGWPTSQSLSGKVLLLWVEIREPDPRIDDAGAIYLWIVPVDEKQAGSPDIIEYRPADREPRAYRLKYSRKAHERLFRAREMLKKGKSVILEWDGDSRGDAGDMLDTETEEAEDSGRSRGSRYDGNDQDFRMYELPAPLLPPKGGDG